MALFTSNETETNPCCYLLDFKASTGYVLANDKRLWHNRTKMEAFIGKLLAEAKSRNASYALATITPLFKDKATGMVLPSESAADLTSGFSVKK